MFEIFPKNWKINATHRHSGSVIINEIVDMTLMHGKQSHLSKNVIQVITVKILCLTDTSIQCDYSIFGSVNLVKQYSFKDGINAII